MTQGVRTPKDDTSHERNTSFVEYHQEQINAFVSALAEAGQNPLPGKKASACLRLASSSVHVSWTFCFMLEK